MSLSQLARSVKESATLKLNETAALLREKGEPVILLGGGEPKTKAPVDAIINCASLLNTGEIRYTAPDGIPALKKAILSASASASPSATLVRYSTPRSMGLC
jgi:aspartate aminotransferase